jgi:hypothetical protein
MQKTVHDVRGWQIDCINFHPCPLCYGCRNYDPSYKKCEKCAEENMKQNICNRTLHTEKALAMMIRPMRIDLDE